MSRSTRALAFACTAAAAVAFGSVFHSTSAIAAPIAAPDDAAKMTDGNILALLMGINDSEIAAANVAITDKKVEGDVKSYAEMMLKQHTTNNEKTHALSEKIGVKPEETEALKAKKLKDAEELKELKTKDGMAFAHGYIDMMVKGHEEALTKITAAIADTSNADLKKHLEMTKDHVQHHLDKAKEIQNKQMNMK